MRATVHSKTRKSASSGTARGTLSGCHFPFPRALAESCARLGAGLQSARPKLRRVPEIPAKCSGLDGKLVLLARFARTGVELRRKKYGGVSSSQGAAERGQVDNLRHLADIRRRVRRVQDIVGSQEAQHPAPFSRNDAVFRLNHSGEIPAPAAWSSRNFLRGNPAPGFEPGICNRQPLRPPAHVWNDTLPSLTTRRADQSPGWPQPP